MVKKRGIRVISRCLRSLAIVFAAGCLFGAIPALGPADSLAAFSPQSKNPDILRLVSNPIQPRDGIQRPKLIQEWSVGGENEPQGELINRPFDVRVGKDGSVFVEDLGDTCIRQFDAKGKFVRQIGRKGQGPGEYNSPFYFDLDSSGRVVLVDGSSLRVTEFDTEGKPVSNFRVEKFSNQIRTDGLGRLYLGENSSLESANLGTEFKEVIGQITIVRTDRQGLNPLRIGPFIGQKFMVKAEGQGSIVTSSRSAPITGWSVAPDGRILAGYNEKYEISVYDPDGKPLFRFGREYKPIKVKSDRPIRKGEEYYPAFAPDFFFDDIGNAWFRLFKNDDDKDFLFDVFSPGGVYLKQVVVPFRIYQVRNGKLYGIVETDEGFKALRCYRVG